ncbi:hypothetical protein ACH4CC_35710 [Streptomyces lydicus]|uniref:hypothetical protein n=1 Tax=Streptomyces lydicus TaxID=47763 RepID=UPI0037B11F51
MKHYPGDYASVTTGGYVAHKSRLELARLPLADFDRSVCGIFAQPCHMVAHINGKVRSHVPDFLLVMRSAMVHVVNVKPPLVDAHPGDRQQHGGARVWLPRPVQTAGHLAWGDHTGRRLSGAGRLYRAERQHADPQLERGDLPVLRAAGQRGTPTLLARSHRPPTIAVHLGGKMRDSNLASKSAT